LINSALAAGFTGRFLIGYRDVLPPWIKSLGKISELEFAVKERRITFFQATPARHLGFHKPFALLSALETYPEIDVIYYADPDVAVLAPWKFFSDWVQNGIALVQDGSFPQVSQFHPWRRVWGALLQEAGMDSFPISSCAYANSGFIGLRRADEQFIEKWAKITLCHEAGGENTTSFSMNERWKAVTGDQDLLAATTMAWSEPISMLGPEAMGFTGHYFILSHATESPKPWAKSQLLQALRGAAPTQASKRYLRFSEAPIRSVSKRKMLAQKLDFMAAQLIARFYRRPS
jgi:hypothetical protein